MPYYSFNFIILLACAILFYRAGEFDNGNGVLWALLSVLISVGIWYFLKGGIVGMLLGQVVLFLGIGIYRTLRKS